MSQTQTRQAFHNPARTEFYSSLKKKVNAYFTENAIAKTGNRALYSKAAILLFTAVSLYVSLVFFHPPPLLALILCALLGINISSIGFNIMHDANHGSFSKNDSVNYVAGMTLNTLGGNAWLWIQKHNIFHHTYTNINNQDEDISIPFMRAHPSQKKRWYHRYQHIYGLFLYGLTYFLWIFLGDFRKYFSGKIGTWEFTKIPPKEHVIFWLSKLVYAIIFIAIPLYFCGWERFLVGYGIMLYVAGLFLAVVFQLAHIVQGVEHPAGDITDEWAIHEVKTTANFATKNKAISWLLGGLNFQIEHHLFPRISHIHYPKIQKYVKELCAEFRIFYNEKATAWEAFWSHILELKSLGRA